MNIDVSPFAGFLVATCTGLILSLATLLVARRSGLAQVTTSLVDVLQDNVGALSLRVTQLEDEVNRERQQRITLEIEVRRLRDALSDVTAENVELRRKGGLEPRAAS